MTIIENWTLVEIIEDFSENFSDSIDDTCFYIGRHETEWSRYDEARNQFKALKFEYKLNWKERLKAALIKNCFQNPQVYFYINVELLSEENKWLAYCEEAAKRLFQESFYKVKENIADENNRYVVDFIFYIQGLFRLVSNYIVI